MVEKVLSIFTKSCAMDINGSPSEDVRILARSCMKVQQALSDVSALPLFADRYPLDSSLSGTLKLWLEAPEYQFQACSCVILGNLARSDEICKIMVYDLELHKPLISILQSNVRGSVLHAALGFLKNLAIAVENRSYLGDAGIVPALSRLWAFDTVPQVQFAATSLARLITVSSTSNVSRLLDFLPPDQDSPRQKKTYLSLLLSLFNKTDSKPAKTEIGRTVASICRTIKPGGCGESAEANITERVFSLHEDIANPIMVMISQTEWPVVRSEGWFALALMTSHPQGALAVADCLNNADIYQLLESNIRVKRPESASDESRLQQSKDRDNTIILVKELLSHNVCLL
jgi:hypothetical protein